jgi:hypothetical protein
MARRKGDLEKINEPVFREYDPSRVQPDAYYGVYMTKYSREKRSILTGRMAKVFDAILTKWKIGHRDIECSNAKIEAALNDINIKITQNHISTIIAELEKHNLIKIITSKHNLLILRINPFVLWCGKTKHAHAARKKEKDQWLIEPAEHQQALMSSRFD